MTQKIPTKDVILCDFIITFALSVDDFAFEFRSTEASELFDTTKARTTKCCSECYK